MTDAVTAMLIDLDARIAELVEFRDRVLATLGEVRVQGKAPPPAAESEPADTQTYTLRPGTTAAAVVSALRHGPLTSAQISERIGKSVVRWYEVAKKCPLIERENPDTKPVKGKPALWRLSDLGRAALAGPSAATAPGGK